ncbi:MAG: hypothetical protein U0169_23320 [Polyangiaceae bacterium]
MTATPNASPPPRWSPKLRGTLVLVLTFALGIAVGSAGTFGTIHRRHAAMLERGPGGPFAFQAFEGRRLEGLARRLDLDADQRGKIRTILEKEREDVRVLSRTMFETCGAPLRDQKSRAEAEIRAVLRPDQRAKFDSLVDERRERIRFGGPRR